MRKSDLVIVADENMPAVEQIFGRYGQVKRVAGRQLCAEQVVDADLLLVRSISQVNESLLAQSSVSFVGTATIGTDHIDKEYLASQGIGFSAAPGCNADAVVDYVLSSLYQLAAQHGFTLQERTVGIVGVGNVGGRLRKRLEAMNVSVLLNDPPKAHLDSCYVELDELLSTADIVCLHTPLTREGKYATQHLISKAQLELLKPNAILLNAGRGPVIDNVALLSQLRSGQTITLVLDVWEHEPVVDAELAGYCSIATPHIAGYSLDGKIRGTYMLYQAWCEQQGVSVERTLSELLPSSPYQQISLNKDANALDLIRLCYDPYRDDRALRKSLLLPESERALAFDQLRKNYPKRRELLTLPLISSDSDQCRELNAIGFSVLQSFNN